MGTTILYIEKRSGGWVATRFKGRRGGAKEWMDIVDGFGEAIDTAISDLGTRFVKPEERRTLGQGAIVMLPADAAALAYVRWRLTTVVGSALACGELEVRGLELLPIDHLISARNRVAEERCSQD